MLASRTAQSRAKDHASLRKLIVELRAVTLNANKITSAQKTQAQIQEKTRPPAQKEAKEAVKGQIETMVTTSGPKDKDEADKENVPMSSNNSSQGSEETTTGSGKKKQKKKKRSVLANQSNPHHVDNCTLLSKHS